MITSTVYPQIFKSNFCSLQLFQESTRNANVALGCISFFFFYAEDHEKYEFIMTWLNPLSANGPLPCIQEVVYNTIPSSMCISTSLYQQYNALK